MEYGTTEDGKPYVRLLFAYNHGKSMWFPLHEAALKWHKDREEAHGIWLADRARAAAAWVDGRKGK